MFTARSGKYNHDTFTQTSVTESVCDEKTPQTTRLLPQTSPPPTVTSHLAMKSLISLVLVSLTAGEKEASGRTDGNILTPICGKRG